MGKMVSVRKERKEGHQAQTLTVSGAIYHLLQEITFESPNEMNLSMSKLQKLFLLKSTILLSLFWIFLQLVEYMLYHSQDIVLENKDSCSY